MIHTGCTVTQFRQEATQTIGNASLQKALRGATAHFVDGRQAAFDAFPDGEAIRDHLKEIRGATISNLAFYLEQFEQNAQAAGTIVHWARNAEEAAAIVTSIARENGVMLAAKSKSMATEEIKLNHALEAADVRVVETDLGEWIIQLAGESPYHIIGPAIHKTKEQIVDLFEEYRGRPLADTSIAALTAEARHILRQQFLEAGIGISGGNMGVAETGSLVLVTNEGNGRMVTTLPRIHVAVMGIEKIAPDWDAAAAWLSLLARSATGQPMSIYTTVVTGPRRPEDADGPEEVHIVLLDNGRASLADTSSRKADYAEILQCIRCGACLNVCPVYGESGGHAYNSPYSGPIGAVISPLLFGLEKYAALPHASTLCGACVDVCPARIDLPRMLLALRADEVEQGIPSPFEQFAERAGTAVMGNAHLFNLAGKMAGWGQKMFTKNGTFTPPINPTLDRNLPIRPQKSFRDLWNDLDTD